MERRIVANNEEGFVLVGALLILLLLVLIGIAATTTTTVEIQVAGADRMRKETFYNADSGVQLAARLVEENLGCSDGFADGGGGEATINGQVQVTDIRFSQNTSATMPSDANRDLYYPQDYAGNEPHTNMTVGGTSTSAAGAGLQMIAGYEGKGKGSAGGGGLINFNIYSQHKGQNNSESVVQAEWQHVVGQELECRY